MKRGTRTLFLGGGQMGEAMIAGMLSKGLVEPESIMVSDPLEARCDHLRERYGVRASSGIEAAKDADVVVVAVKPQVLAEALGSVRGAIKRDATVISIVAGATLERISSLLGRGGVVRVMPNTPAMVGRAMSVWTAQPDAPDGAKSDARDILSAIGDELEAADESYLDKATAVSGSGPAYALLFIEALADAAVGLGFARDKAFLLASRTVWGAAEYMAVSGEHPAVLRNRVTSPGGTTAAALSELEAGAFRSTVEKAVRAAYKRAQELGKA